MANSSTQILSDLFLAHGFSSHLDDDWVLPESLPHAIRASWHPAEANGRLDIDVLVGDSHLVKEPFAGIGAGDEGLRDAFLNFSVNSFHVLLAALWDTNLPDQVTTEVWHINGNRYKAHIGNFGTRASEGAEATIPVPLFPAIQAAIQAEQLSGDFHWFRTFFCNVAGKQILEALRDNEEWEAGRRMLKSIPWEPSPGYYSIRLFMTLKLIPAAAPETVSVFGRIRSLMNL